MLDCTSDYAVDLDYKNKRKKEKQQKKDNVT